MVAAQRVLMADRGATFRLSVRYLTPEGSPVDLTGYAASLELLPVEVTNTATATYTGTAGADGWVTVTVADEVTAAWGGPYAYRLVLTRNGERDFLLVGRLSVRTPGDV